MPVVVLVLAVRIWVVGLAAERVVGADEIALLQSGRTFWTGAGLVEGNGSPLRWTAPLMPVALGIPTLMTGNDELAGSIAYVLYGALATGLAWFAIRAAFPESRWAPFASLIIGVWPSVLMVPLAGGSMTEPWATAALAALLLAALKALATRRAGWWLATAVAAVVLWQSRSEFIATIPVIVLLALLSGGTWGQRARALGSVGLGLALGVPFVIRASLLSGGPALSTVDACYVWAYRQGELAGNFALVDGLRRECAADFAGLPATAATARLLDPAVVLAGLAPNLGRLWEAAWTQVTLAGVALVIAAAVLIASYRAMRPIPALAIVGILVAPLAFFVVLFTVEGRYMVPAIAMGWTLAVAGLLAPLERRIETAAAGTRTSFAASGLLLAGSGIVLALIFLAVWPTFHYQRHPLAAYKEAARRIAAVDEQPSLVSRRPEVLAYYAGAVRSLVPEPGLDARGIVDYALSLGVPWIVVGPVEMQQRAGFLELASGYQDPRLDRVWSLDDALVFRVHAPPSPSNAEVTNPIALDWPASTDATRFAVWLGDATGVFLGGWQFSRDDVCGRWDCSYRLPVTLTPGVYTWTIGAWNQGGVERWLPTMQFTVTR